MGESLKDVVRRAHGMKATAELADDHEDKVHPAWVLPRHDAWMERPEDERVWSPAALEFANDVLAGRMMHERSARISPSSMGDGCERVLLFAFAGAPKMPFPKDNAEKMSAGQFHHLRWQMEGLSAGYMDMGEVWLHSKSLRCGGSGDGRLSDKSLFELKSTASHLFKCARELLKPAHQRQTYSASNYFAGMHAKHKLQMEAYWLVDRVQAAEEGRPRLLSDWGSLVYQDAGSPGDLVEFRLHSSPAREKEVHRILEGLHDWIDLDDLPDMLDGCHRAATGQTVTDGELTVFNRCAYRKHCPTATRVSLE